MKRAVQTVLVLVAVVCSLVLSGTATVALAASAKVPGFAQPAAIGVIEVVLATGTWIWVTDRELRREAAAAVVLASVVSAYAGVHAFGAFGLIGPAASLVTTHLVARSWSRERTPAGQPQPVTVTPPAEPIETASEGPELNRSGSGAGPEQVAWATPEPTDDEMVADLRGWIADRDGKMPGRDAVKARFAVGSERADKLRQAAAESPVRRVM